MGCDHGWTDSGSLRWLCKLTSDLTPSVPLQSTFAHFYRFALYYISTIIAIIIAITITIDGTHLYNFSTTGFSLGFLDLEKVST